MDNSTQRVSPQLMEEIKSALNNIRYGSVEIYIQDMQVTQITVRNIKKTKLEIDQRGRQKNNMNTTAQQSLRQKLEVLTIQK